MAFKTLTETGKEFIREVIVKISNAQGDTALIKGKNSYNLPLSDLSNTSVLWVANLTDFNGRPITNNIQFGEYIIESFNKNSKLFELDANIIAAQAFQESTFKCWNYAPEYSTASGIGQFLMAAVYDSIYTFKFTSTDEKAKLTLNMEDPDQKASWIGVLTKYTTDERAKQFRNHSILHQNITDNPDIMIKLQCALMGRIGDRNNNLASNSLFAYNRGSSYKADTYSGIINLVSEKKGNEYIKEGVKYVERIFGYLGDKDNTKVNLPPIVKGLWFGYKNIDFGFDEFNANVASSQSGSFSTKSPTDLLNNLRTSYISAKADFELFYENRYRVDLQSVHRSPLRQNELFQVGRDARGNVIGNTITPIDGFNRKSNHNYLKAKAYDYSIFDTQLGIYVKGDRSKPNTDYKLHGEFAAIVQTYEPKAVWGGTFRSPDPIHIAYRS